MRKEAYKEYEKFCEVKPYKNNPALCNKMTEFEEMCQVT